MRARSTGRVIWPRLAGVVLLLDGVLGLLGALLFFFITMFPPVAAIEGRPSVEQSWLGQGLFSLALAIAGLWSGQRAIRAIRRGRLVGVAVAGAVVATVLAGFATADSFTAGDAAISLGILGFHVAVGAVLLAWPSVRS